MIFGADCCGGPNPRFGGTDIDIRRADHNVTVSEPIFRARDPACCPTGHPNPATWGSGATVRFTSLTGNSPP